MKDISRILVLEKIRCKLARDESGVRYDGIRYKTGVEIDDVSIALVAEDGLRHINSVISKDSSLSSRTCCSVAYSSTNASKHDTFGIYLFEVKHSLGWMD